MISTNAPETEVKNVVRKGISKMFLEDLGRKPSEELADHVIAYIDLIARKNNISFANMMWRFDPTYFTEWHEQQAEVRKKLFGYK